MTNSLFEFDAIGTHWWIERLDDAHFTDDITKALLHTATMFDKRYSRFRDDSLVAELANTGQLDDAPAEFIRMLEFSRQLYEESDGSFNITVGGVLHGFGYGSRLHGSSVLPNPWASIVWRDRVVQVPRGLMLDFGGFGKGWLIELFADVLRAHDVRHFLINGGGDIYVDAPEPIEFALEHPLRPDAAIGQTRIQKGALAGSSSLKRTWQSNGNTHHHIIDPKTERSTENEVVASFVRGDSALMADTIATIIMIRPELEKPLKQRYNLQTILVNRQDLS